VWPRWRQIALAFVFTAGLAATTGGYPLIIKHSFDSLMQSDSHVLPWVLAAIVLVTTARSVFLYLHQVASAQIVTRMTTDMQKAAFAHLIVSGSPASRARPQVTRVAAHESGAIQRAIKRDDRVRQGHPVGARRPDHHALARLDAYPSCSPSFPCGATDEHRPALRSVSRRTLSEIGDDLTSNRGARRRPSHQGCLENMRSNASTAISIRSTD
jgi:hypothetical protein